jgi:hypothetical protein
VITKAILSQIVFGFWNLHGGGAPLNLHSPVLLTSYCPEQKGIASMRFANMDDQSEDKRSARPNLLRALMERRRRKKRAPSLDETLESSNNSVDRTRNRSPINSEHKDNLAFRDHIPTVEEEDSDDSLLKDSLYKQDIALANRVAALTAQQLLSGENHPDVLFSLQSLAAFHRRRGEHALSQRVLDEIQLRGERAHNECIALNVPSEIVFQS